MTSVRGRSPWRSFLRSRVDERVGWGLLVAIAIQGALSGTTLTLPFAVLPLVQEAAPLLPAAVGCLVGAVLVRRMPEVEAGGGLVLLRYRATLALLVLAAAPAVSSVGLISAPARYDAMILRNACFLAGLALIGARLLGARLAWLPVLLLALITFLDGKNRYDGSARGWALLLQPAADVRSIVATFVVSVLGVAIYTFADSRAQHGIRES